MIYLIECSDKTGTVLLKIGFSDNIEKRFQSYRTSNPLVKFLKTREGDQRLEKLLHSYFREYKYKHYSEWFVYNDEIVEKFETLTAERLKKEILEKEKEDFVFKLGSLRTFNRKLKYLSDYLLNHPEDADRIPEEFIEYLNLGRDVLIASNYRKDHLDEKLGHKSAIEDLSSKDIYKRTLFEYFEVGKIYSKKEIKQLLKKVSEDLGYNLKMKASDISRFFEILGTTKRNENTGMKEAAFKILRQKES